MFHNLFPLSFYHSTLINKLRTGVSASRFQPGCLSMSAPSSLYEDAPSPCPEALRVRQKGLQAASRELNQKKAERYRKRVSK